MVKPLKIKLMIVLCLSMALIMLIFSAGTAIGQDASFNEIKDKLSKVSSSEKNMIQKLFIQAQKVEEMEFEEKQLSSDIKTLRKQIFDLKNTIKDEEIDYKTKKEMLRQVLSTYQRMGSGSYLEILLEADSLPDLLRRINILRDLTRNTGALLEQIQENKEKQSIGKNVLSEKLTKVESNQKQLEHALVKDRQLKAEMERYLVSLSGQRELYQQYLDKIQNVFGEIKPIFAKAIDDFSSIVYNGSFPMDALKITYENFRFKISITEKALNDIITSHPQLTKIVFKLHQGTVEVSMPEKNLMLKGKIIIVDDHTLKFDLEKGSFLGLPLEASTVKRISDDNDLRLNFESQLQGFKIDSIKTTDGNLNIILKP